MLMLKITDPINNMANYKNSIQMVSTGFKRFK